MTDEHAAYPNSELWVSMGNIFRIPSTFLVLLRARFLLDQNKFIIIP